MSRRGIIHWPRFPVPPGLLQQPSLPVFALPGQPQSSGELGEFRHYQDTQVTEEVAPGETVSIPVDSDLRVRNIQERDKAVVVESVGGQGVSVVAFSEEITSGDSYCVLPCIFLPDLYGVCAAYTADGVSGWRAGASCSSREKYFPHRFLRGLHSDQPHSHTDCIDRGCYRPTAVWVIHTERGDSLTDSGCSKNTLCVKPGGSHWFESCFKQAPDIPLWTRMWYNSTAFCLCSSPDVNDVVYSIKFEFSSDSDGSCQDISIP